MSRVKYREAEGERPRGQVDVRSGHPGGCWSAVDTAPTTDQPTRNPRQSPQRDFVMSDERRGEGSEQLTGHCCDRCEGWGL